MPSGMYYNVDDILAEEERIPTVFLIEALNLGYLDPNSSEEDLARDTKMDIPFWMASVLAARNMVQLHLPRCFTARFKTSLLADPTVVNLHDRCASFYDLGTKIGRVMRDNSLSKDLLRAFASRYKKILDCAESQVAGSRDHSEFARRLTITELKLFKKGLQSALEFQKWKTRKFDQIACSEVVHAAKKRRRRM